MCAEETSACALCLDSSTEFLGRVSSVMFIPSLVDSNHPFIEELMVWQVLTGRRPSRSEQSLTPLPSAGRMWEDTGKILQIFYF